MKKIVPFIILLLGFAVVNAQSSFTCNFTNTSNSGPCLSTIEFNGTCTNTDCCNNVTVSQIIVTDNLPIGWSMTMCNPNGCHSTTTTSNTFIIGPSSSSSVKFQIHAGANPGTGTATVRFENAANANDFTEFVISATADNATGIAITSLTGSTGLSQNYPNPFTSETKIAYRLTTGEGLLRISDLAGKTVRQFSLTGIEGEILLSGELEKGTYIYSLLENGKVADRKKLLVFN